MNTQNDGWIKIDDGGIAIDFPAWLYSKDTCQMHFWRSHRDMTECEPLWRLYSHYLPESRGPKPAPPDKEPTQREKDEAALSNAWLDARQVCSLNSGGWFAKGWKRALAYRDKQNAEDLKAAGLGVPFIFGKNPQQSLAMDSLRHRCGLDQ